MPFENECTTLGSTDAVASVREELWLLGQPVRVRPLWVSKLNTASQLVLVAVALALAGFGPRLPGVLDALVWVVAGTTLVSGAAYVWKVARAR